MANRFLSRHGCTWVCVHAECASVLVSVVWQTDAAYTDTSVYYSLALLLLLSFSRSLQSLASELTTIEHAINHPDKSVSIAWLGRRETLVGEEEEEGNGGGGRKV